ncbi:MAG TPA: hypothetical protein VK466_18120, partial [Terriglobales bacterium]|nr:hypothetical protein [Terriglobales bacterium]
QHLGPARADESGNCQDYRNHGAGGEELPAHKLGVWSRLELALYVAGHGGADWAVKAKDEAESQTVPA